MKEIPLSQGKVALVDDSDYEMISQFNWCIDASGYAVKRFYKYQPLITMHRLILLPPKGYSVDHINRNKLDNRKDNLRLATNAQNTWNTGSRSGLYKGVHKIPNRWRAQIKHRGKVHSLGSFKTAEEAAIAYNQAAIHYFGEFAYLNVIQ